MPVALDLAPLIAMAVVTAAILFLAIYKATFGALIQAAITLMEKATVSVLHVSFNPFSPIITPLRVFDNYAYTALGNLIQADRIIWTHFVHWNAYAWQEVSGAIADVAQDGSNALGALRRATIPLLIGGATIPLIRRLTGLESRVTALEHVPSHVITSVERVVEAKTTVVKPVTVEHITKVVESRVAATAGAIANPWPRIRDVEHDASEAWQGVKRIGKTLTPAGILGLVGAAVIGQMGLGWTRCKGVGRVGKSLCGISGLIESLFLDAVDALLIGNLCYLIEVSTVAAATISPVITEYGDELNVLLKCRGIDPSHGPRVTISAVPVPWAHLSFGLSAP